MRFCLKSLRRMFQNHDRHKMNRSIYMITVLFRHSVGKVDKHGGDPTRAKLLVNVLRV
jgi:hypothetical protein